MCSRLYWQTTHMLLYLNAATFCDGGGTATLVCAAMDAGVNVVLVQELDAARGACAFRCFFEARHLLIYAEKIELLIRRPRTCE